MIDEIIAQKFDVEDDVLHATTTQPTEDLILSRNQKLRNSPDVLQDLKADNGESYGRLLCSIPQIMYTRAIKDGYDLNSQDSSMRSRELYRFLKSDDGKLCLVA